MKIGSAALVACVFAALLHCGGGDDSAAPTNDGGGDVLEAGTSDTGSSDGATPEAGTGTIDVHGVLQSTDRPPVPQTNVALVVVDAAGTKTNVTTGADGTFHVANVAPPYDVYEPVANPDGGPSLGGDYFAGLTRPDPALALYPQPRGASIKGTVTFSGSFCSTCQVFASTSDDRSTMFSGTGASSSYTWNLAWYGASSVTRTLHFWEVDTSTKTILARLDLSKTLTEGTTVALGALPTFTTVTPATTTVVATMPGGYTFAGTREILTVADGSSIFDFSYPTVSSSVSLPNVSGISIQPFAAASRADTAQSSCTVSYPDYTVAPATLSVPLPEAPTALTPADKATSVPPTRKLTWSAFASGGTYAVQITEPDASYEIYTDATSIDPQHLALAGIMLPSNVSIGWSVNEAGVATSMDELTKPGGATPAAAGVIRCSASAPLLHYVQQ
ncbi:MAG TPA: hypothetical protein VF407_16285 [Polyangiaceae bacterium]